MKKVNLLAIVAILSLVFTACSSDGDLTSLEQNSSLLKTVQVKKDYNGDYYLDFTTKGDVKVDKVFDQNTNSNQFFVSSSPIKSNRKFTESLSLNNSELKIGFVDMSSSDDKSITIIDDKITLAKGNARGLTSYNITSQENGLVTLDFTVSNGISVDFTYNEDIDTYEINLDNGKSNSTSYSRNFEVEEGGVLRIDFVNHYKNKASKSESLETERKPRVIIDNGGSY